MIQRGEQYLWGDVHANLPQLPGYTIECAPGTWVRAVREGRAYLIAVRDRVYILFPITDVTGRVTTVGPPGPIFPKAEVLVTR